jgi:hypothetical protein
MAGKVFAKSSGGAWLKVKHQSPAPKIEVYKPNESKAYLTFAAEQKVAGHSQKLLNYSFSGGVDDLLGAFSFAIEDEEKGVEKKTVFDAIPERSVIKIYEADKEKPVFVGIVKHRRIKSSMTAQGPRRSIVISGKSIISVLAEYMVSLDFKIMNVKFAENATRELTSALNKKQEENGNSLSIQDFMTITWNFFWETGTGKKATAIASAKAGEIIDKHIGSIENCITTGAVKNIHYPIANAPFNQGNNVISELWRNILPQPVYEIFAYCDRENGKPKIMSREVPFGFKDTGNQDWKSLDMYEIDPLDLIDYDLSRSDEEVYTAFFAYLIGSAFSREYNIAKGMDKQDSLMIKDEEKMDLYGYRPLEVSFRGYDTQGTETDDLTEIFKQLNEKTKYWYGRLDDMYSGTITLATDFELSKDGDRNPRYGCRAKFLGGEFYITSAEHHWQYGGTPTVTLTVTRGMKYDAQGYMEPGGEGVLSDIGKQFKEME